MRASSERMRPSIRASRSGGVPALRAWRNAAIAASLLAARSRKVAATLSQSGAWASVILSSVRR